MCDCVFLSLRAHQANCDVPLCSDRVQDCEVKVQGVAPVWNLDLCLFYFVTAFVCLVSPVADSVCFKILAATPPNLHPELFGSILFGLCFDTL